MAKELRKGQRLEGLPADDWNEFCRTAKQFAELRRLGNGTGQVASLSALTPIVFNKTGADITARFPVLKLSAPMLTTAAGDHVVDDAIQFEGETPDANTMIGDVAILQGPVRNDEEIAAVLIGHTWCDVSVTDSSHEYAGPTSGDDTKLTSGASGAKILWKPSGTGVKRCLVYMGVASSSSSIRYARVTTEITPATDELVVNWGSGEVRLMHPTTGALEASDTPVVNPLIGMTFIVDAQVEVDMSHYPPHVLNGTCDAVAWSA